MAWSATALSADAASWAALQADVDCFIGDHVLRDYMIAQSVATLVRWTTGGTSTSTNRNPAGQPLAMRNLYDGAGHRSAAHNNAAASATWYVNAALDGAEFDSLIFFGDNLDDATQIDLQIADDGAFTSNLATLATWTVGGSYAVGTGAVAQRMAHCLLSNGGTASRFSGVDYLRLKLASGGNWRPEIRELWIGQRSQPHRHPLIPLNDTARMGIADVLQSRAGLQAARERFAGAAARELRYVVDGDTEAAMWRTLWQRAGFGARSFGMIEHPYTAPVGRIVVADSPRLPLLWGDGPTRRDLALTLREIPSFAEAV